MLTGYLISSNIIPQKDTISYMAQTCNPLNSHVLTKFFQSATIPSTLHYSEFTDKYYPQSHRLSIGLFFMTNIIFLISLPNVQPLSLSYSQSNPLPNHYLCQQLLFSFPANHPTSPVCTLNQLQNSILKSSQIFYTDW